MLSNTQVKIRDVKLTSNAPFFSNRAVSGKYQRRYTGIQFYDLEFTAQYQYEHLGLVKKFVAEYMYGRPFDFNISYAGAYTGKAQGNITSMESLNPGARQVRVQGFTGTIEAGTIVQFQNHKKLYTVTDDCVSGQPMKLFPQLLAKVQASELVTYRNPKGRFILTTDVVGYDLKSLSQVKFTATEDI